MQKPSPSDSSADIFSFAVTMYEVFGWQEAYPKKEFKFPWKIAEFISSGQRLSQLENMNEIEY